VTFVGEEGGSAVLFDRLVLYQKAEQKNRVDEIESETSSLRKNPIANGHSKSL